MRLDKFLCDRGMGTRSQVKESIRAGAVSVNGTIITKPDTKIEEKKDLVTFRGEPCVYQNYVYYMLNKPAGVVSATQDLKAKTVLDLMSEVKAKDVFPVGRLDKDTEGLLLITNDGAAAHRLLSPKKHVDKVYLAGIREPLGGEEIRSLEQGVDIGDDKLTLPAKVVRIQEQEILLTIQEGRYHQVKRMLQAVGNEVLTLKRVAFGPLVLDEGLRAGEYRELTEEERQLICPKQ